MSATIRKYFGIIGVKESALTLTKAIIKESLHVGPSFSLWMQNLIILLKKLQAIAMMTYEILRTISSRKVPLVNFECHFNFHAINEK